jgi:hypothetical protein
MKRLAKDLGYANVYDLSIISDYDRVHQITNTYPCGSKRPLIHIIIECLKHSNIENKTELITKYTRFAMETKSIETVTQCEKNATMNVTPWETILAIKIEKDVSLRYMIYCLYTEMAPLRPSEWRCVTMTGDTGNVIEGNQLILRQYKTVGLYGENRLTIPDTLLATIHTWVAHHGSNYLLPGPLSGAKMGLTIREVFGINSGELRKSYVTYIMSTKPTIERRLKLANSMNHSLSAQRFNYTIG